MHRRTRNSVTHIRQQAHTIDGHSHRSASVASFQVIARATCSTSLGNEVPCMHRRTRIFLRNPHPTASSHHRRTLAPKCLCRTFSSDRPRHVLNIARHRSALHASSHADFRNPHPTSSSHYRRTLAPKCMCRTFSSDRPHHVLNIALQRSALHASSHADST